MPTLEEIYGVPVRTPLKRDFTAINQLAALNRQENMQARELTSKINAGLAQYKAQLNEADYNWFDNKVDEINNEIAKEASFGNYANALNKAMELAGTYANDSGLLARIKANQEYETLSKEIKARADQGSISTLTRDRWLSENPYQFDETTQSLKSYDTPVNSINMDNIFTKVNAFTLAKTLGEDIVKYFDKDGNLTEDFSKDITSVGYQRFRQSVIRDKESLQEVFNTLLANDNTAYRALMQDYYDTIYELNQYDERINNTSDPIEKRRLQSFRDEVAKKITINGQEMSAPQYLFSRSEGVLNNLVRNDVSTQITPGTPYKPVVDPDWEKRLMSLAAGNSNQQYWNVYTGNGTSGYLFNNRNYNPIENDTFVSGVSYIMNSK